LFLFSASFCAFSFNAFVFFLQANQTTETTITIAYIPTNVGIGFSDPRLRRMEGLTTLAVNIQTTSWRRINVWNLNVYKKFIMLPVLEHLSTAVYHWAIWWVRSHLCWSLPKNCVTQILCTNLISPTHAV